MISRDRGILRDNSEARKRMIEYGALAEKLHIIVLSRPFRIIKISGQIKGFDLVTTQDPFETGLLGWLAAKIFGARLQLQVHTDLLSPYFVEHSVFNRARVWLAKFLIPRANCIRVVSEKIKNSLVANGYTLNPITTLPIFVDIEKIKDAPIKTSLREKYPQFDFVILMASRLAKEKNIGMAIGAIKEVVKKYPKTGLIIVGSGPEGKNLKFQISNLKIDDNVKMENWSDDLASYYKTADLFLLTSNYEGYGLTLVEAAAAGSKIISSDVGIASEILEPENIFEPENIKQLEEKLLAAIRGEIKPAKLPKAQTKKQYLEEYKKSWEACV